jgi:hypothetical protein
MLMGKGSKEEEVKKVKARAVQVCIHTLNSSMSYFSVCLR